MSYRDRLKQPNERAIEDHTLRSAFRRVFNSPEGAIVLDHIVQRICGVDAIVKIDTDAQAHEVLARKNVGLAIAQLAIPARDETKVEVIT